MHPNQLKVSLRTPKLVPNRAEESCHPRKRTSWNFRAFPSTICWTITPPNLQKFAGGLQVTPDNSLARKIRWDLQMYARTPPRTKRLSHVKARRQRYNKR